jgi:hypothetical protein
MIEDDFDMDLVDKEKLVGALMGMQNACLQQGFAAKNDVAVKFYAQAAMAKMLIELLVQGHFDIMDEDTTIN